LKASGAESQPHFSASQPKGIRQTSREQPTANETRSLKGGLDFKQFREEEAPSKLLIGKKRVQGCENRVNPPFSENADIREHEGSQIDG
jgi:hypothetical protein